MSSPKRLFKIWGLFLLATFGLLGTAYSAETGEFKKNTGSFFKDFFDQNIYDEGTNYLRFDRLSRGVTGKKLPAVDVNIYDEVPDSPFFTNRHARKRLTEKELEEGYQETGGPEVGRGMSVIWADVEEQHLVLYVKDAQGTDYQLRFDQSQNFELETSAEVIASRFYYAIGYNVPQYNLVSFDRTKLTLTPEAYIYDESGFKVPLTPDRFQECLAYLPLDPAGNFRSAAAKMPAGIDGGNFDFQGVRKDDPRDTVEHKDKREIRALRVFSSWLNNYDVRTGTTMALMKDENGEKSVKYYLKNFRSSLGAGGDGAKPPEFGFENLIDYGQTFKTFLTLGLWEKPWQRRADMLEKEKALNPRLGSFDSYYFEPEKFKTQFPNYAFKDMTYADAFWASKIIMSFSAADIRALVKAGKLSDPKDSDYLVSTLLTRRDIIGRYWFSKASPLDDFQWQNGQLKFTDLALKHSLGGKESEKKYFADVCEKNGTQWLKITALESAEPVFDLRDLPASHKELSVFIRTRHSDQTKPGPYVRVDIADNRIAAIAHED